MRIKWLVLPVMLLLASLAQAQNYTASLTASDTGSCNTANACLSVAIGSSGSATLTLAGTFSGTFQFEGLTGGTWGSISVTPLAGGTAVTSATAAGQWQVNVAAVQGIRIRCSTYASGTATSSIFISSISARTGGSGGGAPSGPAGSIFTWATNCTGLTNCFLGVDDDSTDNCGTALTTWLAAVNAYAGPGRAQVWIGGSGAGKAYKLSTSNCNIALTNITNGVTLHLWATLDCAQTADNCIQLGPTGQVSLGPQNYFVDGNGTLYGGASLTTGGIHVEPGVNTFQIEGIHFWGPSGSPHNNGFGANNTTLGSCTNYAIYIDSPVADGSVSNTYAQITTSSSTSGGCGYANPNGGAIGQNTITYHNNQIGADATLGCGSQGLVDGGSYGMATDNNIYGFGVDIRLQGAGHRIIGNQLDSVGCLAHGIGAVIQWGATSSSTDVDAIVINGNVGQFGTGHSTHLFQKAGDSTGTISNVQLISNSQAIATSISARLVGGTPACGNSSVGGMYYGSCYEYGNASFVPITSCGAASPGWTLNVMLAQCAASTAGADVGATNIYTSPSTGVAPNALVYATCKVMVTTQATTLSTLPQCVFTLTDNTSGVSETFIATPVAASGTVGCTSTPAFGTNPAAGYGCVGTVGPFNIKSNTTITFSTINYASSGATAMVDQVIASLFWD